MLSGRFILTALIVLGLAPGTFLRTHIDDRPHTYHIHIERLDEVVFDGPLSLTGAWELTSSHDHFGGFSALVADREGTLLAASDRGWMLTLPWSEAVPAEEQARFAFFAERESGPLTMVDLEGLALDPASGTLWGSYENFNRIERVEQSGARTNIAPEAMREWNANSGPETLLRLSDGRFLVLSEGPVIADDPLRTGLLFPDDPLSGAQPIAFGLQTPERFSPVDTTELPDGSLLVLLRRLHVRFPAGFDAAIMRVSLEGIAEGDAIAGEVIASLAGPILSENWEGITFVCESDDCSDPVSARGSVYVISDDNFSVAQRNLLIRFAWPKDG